MRRPPLFWVRQKSQSQAEVDFVELHQNLPLPIEVKSGAAGKLRSLNRFVELNPAVRTAVRLYRGDFSVHQAGSAVKYQLMNIPYYHASKIHEYLADQSV